MAAITKVDVINGAYSRMRISGLTVNPTPEDTQLALTRLEEMMAQFSNICAGYNFEDDPDPNSLTNVDKGFSSMMKSSLAIRLAADFGKVVPPSLVAEAGSALTSAYQLSAIQKARGVPHPSRMPRGSGNAYPNDRFNRYFPPVSEPPPDCDTNKIFIGDIENYYEDYEAYLDEGEAIASFTISSDAGLNVTASANNDPRIDYTIQAVANSTQGNYQQVKIVITTDAGRIKTRLVDFDVRPNETVGSI